MSQLLAYFRRLLFSRRGGRSSQNQSGSKSIDDGSANERQSKKSRRRTKSLNLASNKEKKTINFPQSGPIIIRNRSQTESVTVERKHVHRNQSAASINASYVLRRQRTLSSNHHLTEAPTLTPSFRNRTSSTSSKPTVILIRS